MKRLLLAMLLVPSLSAGAEGKAARPSDDPMAGWVPPTVRNEAKDRQEIMELFQAMEAAGRKGDLEAAVALVDFPVLMITDDSRGEAMAEAWSREQWTEVMRPFYEKPMKDMKITHEPTIFLLSDSLASVDDVVTMTAGGKTVTSRSSTFLVRRGGEWRVKAMAEGGWGDMMAASRPTAGGARGPASEGVGSGAQGSGSGGDRPAAPPQAPGKGPGTPGSAGGQGAERPTR